MQESSGGLFSRMRTTRESLGGGLLDLFKSAKPLDESLFERIEDELVMADVGAASSAKIIDALRIRAKQEKAQTADQLLGTLREVLSDMLEPVEALFDPDTAEKPFVLLMVGVNGVGKTTTLAKITRLLQKEGKSVMLAACDTFRAAAIEQLKNWGERLEVPVIAQQHGSDAAAVAFDAYQAAKARNVDVLLIDSAGRQHTHGDLMDQLEKLLRVLRKIDETVPHEVMITVDASTGQNALSQIEHFQQAVDVSSLTVTKLDGTAKGGVMLAMAERFGLPIRFIGLGEGMEDLKYFEARTFAEALLPRNVAAQDAAS